MTRFVKGLAPLLGALLVAGCEHAVGGESPYQGHSYIVGIDISGSRTKTDLDESRKLLDDLIDRLQAGDRLTLIEVYQGGRQPARQWSDSVRTPRNGELTGSDRRRLDDFKAVARKRRQRFAQTSNLGSTGSRHRSRENGGDDPTGN